MNAELVIIIVMYLLGFHSTLHTLVYLHIRDGDERVSVDLPMLVVAAGWPLISLAALMRRKKKKVKEQGK